MKECTAPQLPIQVGATYKDKRTGQLVTLKRASAGMIYLEAVIAGGNPATAQHQSLQISVSPQEFQARYELVTAGSQ